MSVHQEITDTMLAMADADEAVHLMQFFKTGKGEYGEGDCFLGIRVPASRALVRQYRDSAGIDDVYVLTASKYHEIRLVGFLLLIEIYNRCSKNGDEQGCKHIVDLYLGLIDYGNNWDLVDLVAPKILGKWLVNHPEDRSLLDSLAHMDGHLWHQRVAIVATWSIICNGEYIDTFRIASKLIQHPHDLIHKATGWMLRETGKRGGMDYLIDFLNRYASVMPRTMLRYAIERFDKAGRQYYMTLK